MKYPDFLKRIDLALEGAIAPAGFQRVAAGVWFRQLDDNLNFIWLQKHSVKSEVCVNLGVHYAFLLSGETKPMDSLLVNSMPVCEIDLRLTGAPDVADQWWSMGDESVSDIVSLIGERALPVFESYRSEGTLASMTASDIELGDGGLLNVLTKVRACLLLALLHERSGKVEPCIEAASAGIRLAGFATGPKKKLKEILKRCETMGHD